MKLTVMLLDGQHVSCCNHSNRPARHTHSAQLFTPGHSPHSWDVDEGIWDIRQGKQLLRRDFYVDKKLPHTVCPVPAWVVAETFWTPLPSKQLHAKTGKHEDKEDEEDPGKEEFTPTQQQLVDEVAHLGDQADQAQRAQGTEEQEDSGK